MDNLKLLNKEEINKAGINRAEAINKGLIKENDYQKYLIIQSLYKKAFDNYLKEIMAIDIDKKLLESNLDYGKIKQDKKHNFHKFSYLGSDYLFVRNFLYIERLTKNEIKKFEEKIYNGDYEVDDEIKNIVKSTFEDVIKVKTENNEKVKVFYDYIVPTFAFDNDALVLYLNYGTNNVQLSGNEFIHNKVKKEIYLDELMEKIKKECLKKLNCSVEIETIKGVI